MANMNKKGSRIINKNKSNPNFKYIIHIITQCRNTKNQRDIYVLQINRRHHHPDHLILIQISV